MMLHGKECRPNGVGGSSSFVEFWDIAGHQVFFFSVPFRAVLPFMPFALCRDMPKADGCFTKDQMVLPTFISYLSRGFANWLTCLLYYIRDSLCFRPREQNLTF